MLSLPQARKTQPLPEHQRAADRDQRRPINAATSSFCRQTSGDSHQCRSKQRRVKHTDCVGLKSDHGDHDRQDGQSNHARSCRKSCESGTLEMRKSRLFRCCFMKRRGPHHHDISAREILNECVQSDSYDGESGPGFPVHG